MGSIVKKIGKVVKKVGKVIKKVAPYVIMAVALYFGAGAIAAGMGGATAGAAAGGAGMAGGVGAATAGHAGMGMAAGMTATGVGGVGMAGGVGAVTAGHAGMGMAGAGAAGSTGALSTGTTALSLGSKAAAQAGVKQTAPNAWNKYWTKTKNFFSGTNKATKAYTSGTPTPATPSASNPFTGMINKGKKIWAGASEPTKTALIQGATTIGASLLAGREKGEEVQEVQEIGFGGNVYDRDGGSSPNNVAMNTSQPKTPNVNAGMASVDQTHGANNKQIDGLIKGKPNIAIAGVPQLYQNKSGLLA